MAQTIRIGTRGSRLALWQAEAARSAVCAAAALAPAAIEIVPIRTSGDLVRHRPLADAGGKGLFTREIEDALLDRRVDLAVHSAKDMETVLPPALTIGACLAREDVRDALVSRDRLPLAELPRAARLGTSSPRRAALLRRARPDLSIGLLRGNVPTRIAKVEAGAFDATLLAVAGLNRLGLKAHIAETMPLATFPPACGQGAVAVECRADDIWMRDLLAAIDHAPTSAAVRCERAFLAALGGSCRTPIAGYARLEGSTLSFEGAILTPDGHEWHAASGAGDPAEAVAIGAAAGAEIRRAAPRGFLSGLGLL
jgi:hydroxymethylbilane synthase